MVSQDVLLEAVHVQPAGVVTVTLPEPALDAAAREVDERAVEQGTEYWNWFEARLVVVPPGPDAATRAS